MFTPSERCRQVAPPKLPLLEFQKYVPHVTRKSIRIILKTIRMNVLKTVIAKEESSVQTNFMTTLFRNINFFCQLFQPCWVSIGLAKKQFRPRRSS